MFLVLVQAKKKGIEITLPCDWACGKEFKNDQEIKMVTKAEGIPEDWEGMDCGPESMKLFRCAPESIHSFSFASQQPNPCMYLANCLVRGDATAAIANLARLLAQRWKLRRSKCSVLRALHSRFHREKILAAKTVVWNGPAGVFEFDNFSKGTKAVLDAVAETTAAGNKGIIGGGDSATAAAKFDMEKQVSFVSTGGGASLELLEGKVLPGIAALDDK